MEKNHEVQYLTKPKLKDEIEKNINFKKKPQKLKSTQTNLQTCDSSHETLTNPIKDKFKKIMKPNCQSTKY